MLEQLAGVHTQCLLIPSHLTPSLSFLPPHIVQGTDGSVEEFTGEDGGAVQEEDDHL